MTLPFRVQGPSRVSVVVMNTFNSTAFESDCWNLFVVLACNFSWHCAMSDGCCFHLCASRLHRSSNPASCLTMLYSTLLPHPYKAKFAVGVQGLEFIFPTQTACSSKSLGLNRANLALGRHFWEKVFNFLRPSNGVPFWVLYYNPLPKNHSKPTTGAA